MGRYKLEFTTSAAREIRKLPRPPLKRVWAVIESLVDDPRPPGCVKLSGDEKYRVRCGDYRILYRIADDVLTVCVVKVGHRKDVYR